MWVQSVEEVDQGTTATTADDVDALKGLLSARGIAAKKISLYGDLEAKAAPLKTETLPARPGSSRKSHLSSSIVF
jgi:hypothetical protein